MQGRNGGHGQGSNADHGKGRNAGQGKPTMRATGKATMGAMGKPTIRIGGTYMAVNLKYYRKLKSLMFEREIDQAYIAQKAGRSRGYIQTDFKTKSHLIWTTFIPS